jgi:hypothetical protein
MAQTVAAEHEHRIALWQTLSETSLDDIEPQVLAIWAFMAEHKEFGSTR